jgi:hypothetical protein
MLKSCMLHVAELPALLHSFEKSIHCSGNLFQGKMMLDTAMKFVGQGSGRTLVCSDTMEIVLHLNRFLQPTHHIIQNLKLRFLSQGRDSPNS